MRRSMSFLDVGRPGRALKSATANMAGWIAEGCKLTLAETAELFGSAVDLLQKLRIGSITYGQTGTRTEIVRALQFAD
jgi:hypothetical protein